MRTPNTFEHNPLLNTVTRTWTERDPDDPRGAGKVYKQLYYSSDFVDGLVDMYEMMLKGGIKE